MKNFYSRLALITSTLLVMGYLIVSAAWVPMTNDATTGTQFTATIWNNLVGNVNDLNSRIGGVISSQWTASGTTVSYTGGNVGIGTTNPWELLSIAGGSGTSLKLSISNLTPSAGHKWTLNSASTGNFYLGDDTAGANRIAVDASGNVGIGTTNPVQLLTLNTITNNQLGLGVSGTVYWQLYSNSTQVLGIANGTNSEKFTILTNGNVGIGMTAPAMKLVVDETTVGDSRTIGAFQATSAGRTPRLDFKSSGVESGTQAMILQTGSPLAAYPGLSLQPSGGNVGIGTANPTSSLYLNDNGVNSSTWDSLHIKNANTVGAGLTLDSTSGNNWSIISQGSAWGAGQYKLWFHATTAYGGGVSGYKMVIQDNGNVGIGTTNPTSKLHLLNAGTSDPSLTHGATAMVSLAPGSGTELAIGSMAGSPYTAWIQHRHQTNDGSSFNLALQPSGGNVGIGTTSPGYKLTVVGPTNDWTIVANPSNSQQYGLLSYGTTWAGYFIGPGYINQAAWSYGSDRRLKENISYFNSGLEKVLQLKPVAYDYISGTKNNLGFIAQDVQRVIPEAVSITDPKTGMLGLKTEFIIPYLVNATKEQQNQIEELRKQNNSLRSLVCLDHPGAEVCK